MIKRKEGFFWKRAYQNRTHFSEDFFIMFPEKYWSLEVKVTDTKLLDVAHEKCDRKNALFLRWCSFHLHER